LDYETCPRYEMGNHLQLGSGYTLQGTTVHGGNFSQWKGEEEKETL